MGGGGGGEGGGWGGGGGGESQIHTGAGVFMRICGTHGTVVAGWARKLERIGCVGQLAVIT